MKRLGIMAAALSALALSACGSSSSDSTPPAPPYTGFVKPAGTVAVTFQVDDTANKVFTAGQLKWKGSMKYDQTTRIATLDSTWSSPWATLYDDGPYTAAVTQHEGATCKIAGVTAPCVAGDHIWSVTVFITPPATGTAAYEYGLIDQVYETNYGNGWIWTGSNGTFNIAAGATADVTATGITLPAFGTTDLQLIIDLANLSTAQTWDTSKVEVKGTTTSWSAVQLLDNATKGDATAGDGKFTFQLSSYVGAGNPFIHSGLTRSGDKPEWIFMFNGKEYKDLSGNALITGITASTKASGAGSWSPQTITLATNKNTTITVP
jgi:hypothetical protein